MCTLLLDMIQYLSRELAPASPPGRPAIHAPRGKYRNCEDMAMNLKEEAKREKKKTQPDVLVRSDMVHMGIL